MPFKSKAKSATRPGRRQSNTSSSAGKGNSTRIVQLRRQYQPTADALRTSKRGSSLVLTEHLAFFPLVFLSFIMWFVYRRLFQYPIWFDESVGKAVFFGLPVFLYASLTRSRSIVETMDADHFQPGLWMGIAVGGVLGFAGTIVSLLRDGVVIQAAPLFAADAFWWEFMLAMMTGFWESLFFFSWIMVVIMEKFKNWPLVNQVLLTAVIFLVFHIPNTLLRFPLSAVGGQLFLLFFFAVGQALIFARVRNIYALTISHAIWGMVLLVHTR